VTAKERAAFGEGGPQGRTISTDRSPSTTEIAPSTAVVVGGALTDLRERLKAEHAAVVSAIQGALAHAMAAGDILIEAKRQLDHGDWLPFLESCDIEPRTAQRYMQVARHREEIEANTTRVSHLSIRDALAQLKTPAKRAESADDPEVERDRKECVRLFANVTDAERESAQWKADHPAASEAIAADDVVEGEEGEDDDEAESLLRSCRDALPPEANDLAAEIQRYLRKRRRHAREQEKNDAKWRAVGDRHRPAINALVERLVKLDIAVARGVFEAVALRGPCGSFEGPNFFLITPFAFALQDAIAAATDDGSASS
jgi:hypothetical protein